MNEVLALLKAKLDKGSTLSDVEFMVCTDELKERYVLQRAKNSHSLGDVPKLWCSDSLMSEVLDIYIGTSYTLNDELLARCSPQQLRRYFLDIMSNKDATFYKYNLNYCPIDMKPEFIDNAIERGDDFEYEEFKDFTTSQKLRHIIQEGLLRLDQEFSDWYKNWLLAKGRDFKIDSIFEEF